VVPNKYPAVTAGDELCHRENDELQSMNGFGVHEVIIETPDHGATLQTLPRDHLVDILLTWRQRMLRLEEDPRLRHVLLFRNEGILAGATLVHPHTQLVALPIVPKRVAEELEGSRSHYDRQQSCIYCDLLDREAGEGTRLITETDSFAALAPYAARFPFETWVLPRRHAASFSRAPEEELGSLAHTLQDLLRRLSEILDRPSYNLILHTSPTADAAAPYYHWHLELLPRLSLGAGFEWGTGFHINPVPPEEAARRLREAKGVA